MEKYRNFSIDIIALGNANVICVTSLFNLKAHITEDVRSALLKFSIGKTIQEPENFTNIELLGSLGVRIILLEKLNE